MKNKWRWQRRKVKRTNNAHCLMLSVHSKDQTGMKRISTDVKKWHSFLIVCLCGTRVTGPYLTCGFLDQKVAHLNLILQKQSYKNKQIYDHYMVWMWPFGWLGSPISSCGPASSYCNWDKATLIFCQLNTLPRLKYTLPFAPAVFPNGLQLHSNDTP